MKLPIDFGPIAEALPHVGPERAGPAWNSRGCGFLAHSMSGTIDGRLKRPHAHCFKPDLAKGFREGDIWHAGPALILELVEIRSHVRVQTLIAKTQGQLEIAHQ